MSFLVFPLTLSGVEDSDQSLGSGVDVSAFDHIRRLAGAAVVFGTTVLVSAVWAHDKHHPELSDWFRSLTNWEGTPCCDGSDATALKM